MILRTEAVVLRTLNYGETSQIVTLFTREKGKLSVMAKGARALKSRFGSSLQPMSYVQAVFYYRPTRSLQTLSECSHLVPFTGIARSLEKITVGLQMVELVAALMQEEEQNPAVFNLLVEVLEALHRAEAREGNLLQYFRLRLASALGFAPRIRKDAVEAITEEGGTLALTTGAVTSARRTSETSRKASRTALRAFSIFARAELADVMRLEMNATTRREVSALVETYLRYHFKDSYPSRSSSVIGQLEK